MIVSGLDIEIPELGCHIDSGIIVIWFFVTIRSNWMATQKNSRVKSVYEKALFTNLHSR